MPISLYAEKILSGVAHGLLFFPLLFGESIECSLMHNCAAVWFSSMLYYVIFTLMFRIGSVKLL